MSGFTEKEAAVLNSIQKSVPFTERPFLEIGERIEISESEVIRIISELKERNVIRNIAGIFNGESLGYYLSLVALKVPGEMVESAADTIGSHPGVSHNYLRNFKYNIWFTLACENMENFHRDLDYIVRETKAEDSLILRNEKLFKIGVMLQVGENSTTGDDHSNPDINPERAETRIFTEKELEAIRLLQKDMPVVERPFEKLASETDGLLSESELFEHGMSFKNEKIMRRYSAILRHLKAGYNFNAMTAWKVDINNYDQETIKVFASEKAVTHLYFRTLYPGRWEHPLFAMVHARSEDELNKIINRLSERSGITDYLSLETIRELKKKKVIYFSNKIIEWRGKRSD